MKITKSQSGDFTRSKGKEVMEAFLKAEGKNINAVYAHNDDMALGAIQAIEEAGLKPGADVILVSIDGVKGAFDAMVAGKLNCTVECNPLLGPPPPSTPSKPYWPVNKSPKRPSSKMKFSTNPQPKTSSPIENIRGDYFVNRFAIVLVAIVVIALAFFTTRSLTRSRIGKEHVFQLAQAPPFLTEDLALAKAWETLRHDGFDTNNWHPVRDGRTAAPDGRTDVFMARNTITPNYGVIMFTNAGAPMRRFVSVELHGVRVVGQTSIPK